MSKMGDLYIEAEELANIDFQNYVGGAVDTKPENPYLNPKVYGFGTGADKVWQEKFEELLKEYEDYLDEQADRHGAGW